MPTVANVKSGFSNKPPRVLIYGVHGVGKTTLAAEAPDPIFLQTEDGLGIIDAPTFGLIKTYGEVIESIGSLINDPHDFQTLVIDSLDWLQPLVWTQTATRNGWKDIETPGYGKGYVASLDDWREILEGLNTLRDERKMTVIAIAHAEIKRFDSPDTEPYDRYQIKLHQRTGELIQENFDCVLFANYKITTVRSDVGFNKKVARGVAVGDRCLYTSERPSHISKNRYAMPEDIPMTWNAIADYVPFFHLNQPKDQ